jgi:cytidine deaminase
MSASNGAAIPEQGCLSFQDWQDIELAHKYRLSLSSSPSQSSFRVLALLFYQLEKESEIPPFIPMSQTSSDGRRYIAGTNDEPGYMGGAICAERAAMVQLRFAAPHKLTKLVIATDSIDPISPGILCREFLAGHGKQVPWDLPVISSGCICNHCNLRDDGLLASFSSCTDGRKHHEIAVLETTIAELYPYPSPYTRLTSKESLALGEYYRGSERATSDLSDLDETAKRLLELAITEARSTVDAKDGPHPIQFGAAVAFEDGTVATSHQSSALEYGCTLDAVSQLATHIIQESSSVPILLVQADQYGIAHAPFAPARSYLTEHGHGDCHILLHETPTKEVVDVTTVADWALKSVAAAKLAPNAPAWTVGTVR